jgi:hypothetical protein
MPLQWRADFVGKARDGAAMSTRLIERVKDAKSPMPPVTTMRPMVSADHVAVLSKWVSAGMPGVEGRASRRRFDGPDRPTWADPWFEGECEYALRAASRPQAGRKSLPSPAWKRTTTLLRAGALATKRSPAPATRVNVEGTTSSGAPWC